ncbi:50S ribosomal protein L24 [Pedobacter sp.]|nr:50S ribosomal protein L24 [Candidatus Saccharibacteria bacterium]
MSANQPTMRIKKGDTVKVITGAHKGKTGKVLRTVASTQLVFIEGLGLVNRRIKPSQASPRGGTKEIHNGFPAGKVALVVDETKGTTSRVGYKVNADGTKVRVAKALKNKEIK